MELFEQKKYDEALEIFQKEAESVKEGAGRGRPGNGTVDGGTAEV